MYLSIHIFIYLRDEVTGRWRKLHNKKLSDFYSSPSIIRIYRAGHVARMREKRNVYRLLLSKPEGKRPWKDQDVDAWIPLRWIW
jgi:hypothetical protein